jgi:molecular chaperone GrpE
MNAETSPAGTPGAPAASAHPGSGDAPLSAADAAETASLAAAAGPSVAELQRQLAEAQARAHESHDLYLRARADIENTRRRAQDDIAKAHKYAVESFAEQLVPVMDSLEKAVENTQAPLETLRDGVSITLRQLRGAFERGRLLPIDPAGQKFDPHRHQAISMVPAPEGVPANHVVAVLQKGWLINDRVLRPALVTVAQAGAPANGAPAG